MSAIAVLIMFLSSMMSCVLAGESKVCDCECEEPRPVVKWYTGGDCGISSVADAGDIPLASRIVGGQDADPHEYPWQVMVVNTGIYTCGGSIINRNWVLTAAHCVNCSDDTSAEVIAGKHSFSTTDSTEQHRTSVRVICCDRYDEPEYANDIALIKVNTPFTWDNTARPICPPGPMLTGGEEVVITGWGDTQTGGPTPMVLQEGSMLAVANADCQAKYDAIPEGQELSGHKIEDCMFCLEDTVGDETRAICHGDSGGPVAQKEGDVFHQYGIVAFGTRNCSDGTPEVKTRVGCYLDWIEAIVPEADRS